MAQNEWENTQLYFSTFGSKSLIGKIGKKKQKNSKNLKVAGNCLKKFTKKYVRPFSVNKEIEYLLQSLHESLFRIFLNFFDSLAGASIGCKLCEDKKKM